MNQANLSARPRARRSRPKRLNPKWLSRNSKADSRRRARRRRWFRKPLVEVLEDRQLLAFNALNLDANNELVNLDIKRGGADFLYEPADLIGVDVSAFDGASGVVGLVGDGDAFPAAGDRAALLEDNSFETGVINLDHNVTDLALQFEQPVTNGPGADIVLLFWIPCRTPSI